MALEVVPLSNEALAIAIQNGDHSALGQLWEQVKGYAYTVVMRYKEKTYAETEDYLQTAFLGVHDAALAFDYSRGSFLTIADWYIRRACIRFYGWNRRGEVQTISYDVPMNADDPDGGDFRDSFSDESLPDPVEGMEREDMQRDVRAAVDELAPRHQAIILQHYFDGQSLEAIGKSQGVTACRINQIEHSALKKMRNSQHIKPYERYYAPVKGVGVRAFNLYGSSAVEHTAIKNIEQERRQLKRDLRSFAHHVKIMIENGYYTEKQGEMVLESYKASLGLS